MSPATTIAAGSDGQHIAVGTHSGVVNVYDVKGFAHGDRSPVRTLLFLVFLVLLVLLLLLVLVLLVLSLSFAIFRALPSHLAIGVHDNTFAVCQAIGADSCALSTHSAIDAGIITEKNWARAQKPVATSMNITTPISEVSVTVLFVLVAGRAQPVLVLLLLLLLPFSLSLLPSARRPQKYSSLHFPISHETAFPPLVLRIGWKAF